MLPSSTSSILQKARLDQVIRSGENSVLVVLGDLCEIARDEASNPKRFDGAN